MKRALVAVAAALVIVGTAAAHVVVTPTFVEQGVKTVITFEAPNERAPHATTSLSVEVPSGITVVEDLAPRGWSSTIAGSRVTWSGGRLEGEEVGEFPLRIMAERGAGTATFRAVQTYEDHESVTWTADLTVLPGAGQPAADGRSWGLIAAGLVVVLLIAASVLAVRFLRRRSLQVR